MQAVNAQLGDFNARIDRLVAAQQATTADLARAVADLRSDHAAGESLARAVDALSRQTRDLGSATAALDGRIRATALLTLSLRLRRDIDAGLPIGRDVAALMAAGPYPGPIDSALQQLRYVNDGAPTMRDLADEFDRVLARFAARADAGSSWACSAVPSLPGIRPSPGIFAPLPLTDASARRPTKSRRRVTQIWAPTGWLACGHAPPPSSPRKH